MKRRRNYGRFKGGRLRERMQGEGSMLMRCGPVLQSRNTAGVISSSKTWDKEVS